MPNIHGLHDSSNNDASDDNSDNEDRRYVGGVDARGGGSGLAVMPNRDNNNDASAASDSIFNLAENAGAGESGAGPSGGGEVRRTITMYRSGFTVDNGPYRRLDDQNNAEFLTSLARGMIPRELSEEASQQNNSEGAGDGAPEVMVGLVDRRGEEYDPERHAQQGGSGGDGSGGSGFQSFSGEGQSLAAAASSVTSGGVIDPSSSSASSTPQPLDASRPSTSIAIRLLNGKRLVVKVNLDVPVSELGQHIGSQAGGDPYVLTSGYPPSTIDDLGQSVEDAGLKGAQVVLKKA